jgi:hypothetical protein
MASIKVTRGQLITFMAAPTNYLDEPVVPSSIEIFLNYKHSDNTVSTDGPISMSMQTDGSWLAEFDTGDVKPGPLFASLRSSDPPGAQDFNLNVVANNANPLSTNL